MPEAAMLTSLLCISLVIVNIILCQTGADTVCEPSTFGWNCNFSCACRNGTCDPVNGSCESGCKEGRYGFGCLLDDACMYDDRGANYTGSVSVTSNGDKCLNWSDSLVQKQGNYSLPSDDGNFCRNPGQLQGQYATNPWCFTSTEGKIVFSLCDNIKNCSCPDGLFGQTCDMFCHCNDPQDVCHKMHGSCSTGCAVGWAGLNCQKRCAIGTYGLKCDQACGHCYNRLCDPETGACTNGCHKGYTGANCTERCPVGWYGRNCDHPCGNCSHEENCHAKTGVCFRGCADGFTGKTCTERICEERSYGQNCSLQCDCNNGTCHRVTGDCYSFKVILNKPTEGLTSLIHVLPMGVGGFVLAAAVCCLILCIVVKIKRKKEKKYKEDEKEFLEGSTIGMKDKSTDRKYVSDATFHLDATRYETVA